MIDEEIDEIEDEDDEDQAYDEVTLTISIDYNSNRTTPEKLAKLAGELLELSREGLVDSIYDEHGMVYFGGFSVQKDDEASTV